MYLLIIKINKIVEKVYLYVFLIESFFAPCGKLIFFLYFILSFPRKSLPIYKNEYAIFSPCFDHLFKIFMHVGRLGTMNILYVQRGKKCVKPMKDCVFGAKLAYYSVYVSK